MPFGMSMDQLREEIRRVQAGDRSAYQRIYAGSDEAATTGDPWQPMRQDLYNDAYKWATQPGLWDAYPGQMTAGMSPWMTQAADVAGTAGRFTPERVSGGLFTTGDWGAYMNPYTQNVIDTTLSDIERSRQIANAAGARSADASTYGGDRNALIEAETNRGYADIAARTSAQLRSQGFDTAAGLMGQDLNRAYGAGLANQSAGLAGQGINLQGAGMLGQFGRQDQMTNQMGMDAAYNEWLRTKFGPMQGFNFLSGMQSGLPMYQPQGSAGSGLLGLGMTAAGWALGGPAGGAAAGALTSGDYGSSFGGYDPDEWGWG